MRACSSGGGSVHRLFQNSAFVHDPKYAAERAAALRDQKPKAVVVCCSDSRVAPEVVLGELDLGRLFVVRSAGAVLDAAGAESVRYGMTHLGVKTIVVLGHEGCGAATAVARSPTGTRFEFPNMYRALAPFVRPPSQQPTTARGSTLKAAIDRGTHAYLREVARVLKAQFPAARVLHCFYHMRSGRVYSSEMEGADASPA